MLYTITEMRRYYFIWYEKKLSKKGTSVGLLMPLDFIFQKNQSFLAFLTFSLVTAIAITSLISLT